MKPKMFFGIWFGGGDKMQEWCHDFSMEENGCCLNCDDSHEGCLCYSCKCKKCWWYSAPDYYSNGKGHCDYTDVLKEEREDEIEENKQKFIEDFTRKKIKERLQNSKGQTNLRKDFNGK